jgi:hypothetical protein
MFDDMTPHEVWTRNKPSLMHLRFFGHDSYVHIPKENRIKMDKRPKHVSIIGYKHGLKGYNLWTLETKKVVYSRDVIYREIKYVTKK